MGSELPTGLSQADAALRLKSEGPNELGVNQRRTLLTIAGEVVREPMFLLLLGAGAIYLAMGDPGEAFVLLGFVLIIMSVTVLQERRTENALEALRDLSSPRALVIREGKVQRIPGREVVGDDILIISEGDRVPADGMVLQAHELASDESMLTGESEAVAKFESANLFAGTMVVRGQGLIQVTAIGGQTELGRIGKSLQDIVTESSPLQEEIGRLTRRLAVIGIGLCFFLASCYWLLRGGWLDALLAGVTLAMGILPQEFPVILIIFLAMGARRIAAQRVLTRRLNAIETLGETTVLCVDKTGTLTQNRMAVAALAVDQQYLEIDTLTDADLPEVFHELIEYALLACETEPHDPMELAIHWVASDFLANTEHLHPEWSLAREYELSPELFAMSHLWRHHDTGNDIVATKGAPEAIADLCHLSSEQRAAILSEAERMADQGLRVLGVAKARHNAALEWPSHQHDFAFEFVGLIGLADPLRPEITHAIAECHQAGIRVVMITGDHPRTAKAIAEQAGMDAGTILTGAQLLSATNQQDLAGLIASANVFARVTPQQKLSIVEALKSHGDVVAMTGDGVNDAPALKAAHIGIAMGKRGTDVAREAASLVLLEDDFAAIVSAIHLGRRIYANLRQAVVYTLAVHVPIIGLSILPVLFGMPLLLAPMHIAFLELVIDPACSVVFEAEQGRRCLMTNPPRSPSERLVSSRQIILSLIQGTLVTLAVILFYGWSHSAGNSVEQSRALAFMVLVVANTVLIFVSRSEKPQWREMVVGLPTVAAWVCGGTLAGLIAIIWIPWVAGIFAFATPSLPIALIAISIGLGMFPILGWVKQMLVRAERLNFRHI